MTDQELADFCFSPNTSASRPSTPPLLPKGFNSSLFTSNFWLKSYTSGCYFYEDPTGKWKTEGTEIFSDTTLFYTHCRTNHLTQFAGGLYIVPNKINFAFVIDNASPVKNPLIYSTVLVVTFVYAAFWAWAYIRDRQEAKRKQVIILNDNLLGNIYCYEIVVFTGSRKEAGTDSKVKIMINGDLDETFDRELTGNQTYPIFHRGAVDSFLMTVSGPLGKLNYLRVWHDNSGVGNMASWYLKHVIVHDLQTREKFHFPCYNWLAVERNDGKIDRTLAVAGAKQIKWMEFEAQKRMSDGHLWLSMFTKPLNSSLARLDRVECCFLLFYSFMLLNLLFYGWLSNDSSSSSGSSLKFGPFNLNVQLVSSFRLFDLLKNKFFRFLLRFFFFRFRL